MNIRYVNLFYLLNLYDVILKPDHPEGTLSNAGSATTLKIEYLALESKSQDRTIMGASNSSVNI